MDNPAENINGRKISSTVENPIDNYIIEVCEKFNPILKKLHFTPNTITILSIITSYIGIYCIYKYKFYLASIFIFIGYFFDSLDGNYARKYDMVTDFGDQLDHFGDISKIILLILVFFLIKIKMKTKIISIVLVISFLILTLWHLGCQEQNYIIKKNVNVLEKLENLCSHKKYIKYSRFFGGGTSILIICIFIFNLKYINKIL